MPILVSRNTFSIPTITNDVAQDFTEEQLLGITALPSIFSIFLYHLLQLAYPLTPLAFQRSNLLAPPKTTIGPKFNIDTPISTRRNTKAYALSLLATTQAIAWIIVAVAAALERDWQTAIGKALASLAWVRCSPAFQRRPTADSLPTDLRCYLTARSTAHDTALAAPRRLHLPSRRRFIRHHLPLAPPAPPHRLQLHRRHSHLPHLHRTHRNRLDVPTRRSDWNFDR